MAAASSTVLSKSSHNESSSPSKSVPSGSLPPAGSSLSATIFSFPLSPLGPAPEASACFLLTAANAPTVNMDEIARWDFSCLRTFLHSPRCLPKLYDCSNQKQIVKTPLWMTVFLQHHKQDRGAHNGLDQIECADAVKQMAAILAFLFYPSTFITSGRGICRARMWLQMQCLPVPLLLVYCGF